MKKIILLATSLVTSSSVYCATTVSDVDTATKVSSQETSAEQKKETSASEALKLFADGKHEEAIKIAEPLAQQGDVDAIYLMGFANESGKATDSSIDKAIEFYRKGVEKKHADSIYRLAFILMSSGKNDRIEEGRSLLEKQALIDPAVSGRILGEVFLNGTLTGKPAPETAASWWEKASQAGDIPSMLLLARFHAGQFGTETKSDQKLANKYFLMAAEKGNAGAMVALGSRILNSVGADFDEKNGIDWLTKAIAAKEFSAHLALGEYKQVVKKDDQAALAAYTLGAEAGQPDCMVRTAAFHLNGKSEKKDITYANELLEKAAKAGSQDAHLLLARELSKEEKPDLGKIYGHLLTAANAGSAIAQNELGLFYFSGKLGIADVSAAMSWFGRATQAGFADAQNNLATMHERGIGVPQNYENAAKLYGFAANQGHSDACAAMARLYANGNGLPLKPELAWAWATLAIEQGDKENAAKLLAKLNKSLTKEQLTAAKKELAAIKTPTTK